MRGKEVAVLVQQGEDGITPACAGKRKKALLYGDWNRDHPRICGEKSVTYIRFAMASGSPPHMRGKGALAGNLEQRRGITPAYAGKSQWAGGLVVSIGDHPRVCGEKSCPGVIANSIKGSPPRMRGKVGWSLSRSRRSGITPAYAGKSFKAQILITPLKDHPRVCGEKCVGSGGQCGAAGSPPRMRGKGTMERKKQSPDRITPAYAGKSPVRVADYRAGEDHPRVCGEKDLELSAETVGLGSPPRMRGKVNLTK